MGYETVIFPQNTTFLVTGGAGFIGSNLCEALLKLGYRVRCLDDLSTGKQANVDLFAGDSNYTFIKGDIKDLDVCLSACEGADYVLNQAAWGSVPRSIEMPLFYCANNIQGTLNMLEAARRTGVKKFVYASSSSVYGGREYLNDIYFGLTRALGVDIQPIYGSERPGDVKHSNADISKARRLLGYEPEWSFERGIRAAIEWYRENL